MGFSELSMGWRNKTLSHAAAQRRGEQSKFGEFRVAPLRRCVKYLVNGL